MSSGDETHVQRQVKAGNPQRVSGLFLAQTPRLALHISWHVSTDLFVVKLILDQASVGSGVAHEAYRCMALREGNSIREFSLNRL